MRLQPLNLKINVSIFTKYQVIKIPNTEDEFVKNHKVLEDKYSNIVNDLFYTNTESLFNIITACSSFIEECNNKDDFDFKEKGIFLVNRFTFNFINGLDNNNYSESYETSYIYLYKIYLYLSFYLLFKYKDINISKNVCCIILRRLDSIYMFLNNYPRPQFEQHLTKDIVSSSAFLLPYILANQLYSDKVDYRNRKNYFNVISNYNTVKKVFTLSNTENNIIMTPPNLLQNYNRSVNIKKDYGLLENSFENSFDFVNYTTLLYLVTEYEILKQLDESLSVNLFNTYEKIHKIVYHPKLSSVPLKLFVNDTNVSSITNIDDNYGIQIIPSIKVLKYSTQDLNFVVQGFNFSPFSTRDISLENSIPYFPGYELLLLNINNIGRFFVTKDNNSFFPENFTTDIYKNAVDLASSKKTFYPLISLSSNCVFKLNETVSMFYLKDLVLEMNKDIRLNELIIIDNKIITIYREISNTNTTTSYSVASKPSNPPNFNFCSSPDNVLPNTKKYCTYIYDTETLNYTYDSTSFSFGDLKNFKYNDDTYTFNNFTSNGNVIINKNSKPYVLCPHYCLADQDIITEKYNGTIYSFKYSEMYNQWYKL